MTGLFGGALSAIQSIALGDRRVLLGTSADSDHRNGHQVGKPEYSASDFGCLLSEIRNRLDSAASARPVSEASSGQLVEAIRQATEVLVWGERHDEAFFDLFCESQVLASFVRALLAQATPEVVQVQLLQTLSILVQNAHRDTSFFYLLSGGHLNTLLGGALDFEDEEVGYIYGALNLQNEEVLAYFLGLVKGLALRLDGGSAQLCIDTRQATSEAHGFPLFAQAVRFTTHKDPMVRTGARAALLSILRIDHPKVRGHTVEAAMLMLVPSLAHALRVAWAAASAAVRLQDGGTLQMALEAEEDLLVFLNDLLLLDVPALGEALAQGVLAGALLPLLVGLVPPMASVEQLEQELPAERTSSVQEMERAIVGETAGLEPAQRGLVGAVVERVLGHAAGGATTSASATSAAEVIRNAPQGKSPSTPSSPSRPMRLIASVEDEGDGMPGSPSSSPNGRRAAPSAKEASPEHSASKPPVLPTAAVAVRAVAACARALGTHRHVVEPLAKVLLWPSLPVGLASAVHSPGADGAHLAAALFGEDAWQTRLSGSSHITSWSSNNMKGSCTLSAGAEASEANPFRRAILALIGDGQSPAPAEAPIVAWTFLELQASLSPSMLEGTGLLLRRTRRPREVSSCSIDSLATGDGSQCSSEAASEEEVALPERLITAISVHARLPRIAQRAVASALVDLVSPPRAWATRQRTAKAAAEALQEAGEYFRESMRSTDQHQALLEEHPGSSADDLSSRPGGPLADPSAGPSVVLAGTLSASVGVDSSLTPGTASASQKSNDPKENRAALAIAAFLEEWEWHRHRHSPIDLPAVCGGVQCLLRSGDGHPAGMLAPTAAGSPWNMATHAARSLLTLRHFCAELAALHEGTVQDAHLELCPLKVDSSISEAPALSHPDDPQYAALEGSPTTGVLAETPHITEFVAIGEGQMTDRSAAASVILKAAEAIECTELGGEDGNGNTAFGYTSARTLVLHPTLLLLTEPPIGDGGVAVVRARMPVWQVVSSIDASDPHLLRVTVPTATRHDGSEIVPSAKELVLHFRDLGGCARAVMHIEGCRAREVQRLLTQLQLFVDTVLSEAGQATADDSSSTVASPHGNSRRSLSEPLHVGGTP